MTLFALATTASFHDHTLRLAWWLALALVGMIGAIIMEGESIRELSHTQKPDLPADFVRISKKLEAVTWDNVASQALITLALFFCAIYVAQSGAEWTRIAFLLFGIRMLLVVAWLIVVDSRRGQRIYLLLPRSLFRELRQLRFPESEMLTKEDYSRRYGFIHSAAESWTLPPQSERIMMDLMMNFDSFEVEESEAHV